jgi:PKD repeat protein
MAAILKKFNSIAGYSVGDETHIDVIDANGNVSANNLAVSGDANITGNLNVTGAVSYIQSTVTYITDPITEVGGGSNGNVLTTDDSKDRGTLLHYYGGGSAIDAFIGWDNSNTEFALASNVSVANNVVSYNDFGNIRVGNLATQGNLTVGEYVGSNLVPLIHANGDPKFDLGSQTHPWKDLWLSGFTIQLGTTSLSSGTNNTFVTANANIFTNLLVGNIDSTGYLKVGNLTNTKNAEIFGNLTSYNANLGNLAVANYVNVAIDVNVANGNILVANGNANIVGNITSLNADLGNLAIANFVNVAVDVNVANGNILVANGNANIVGNITSLNANLGNLAIANFVNVAVDVNVANGNILVANGWANVVGNITSLNAGLGNLATANYVNVANDATIIGNLASGNANLGNLATANYVNVANDLTVIANVTSGNANLGNLVTANYVNIANNLSVVGDANINGNLIVLGTVSYIESTTTYITDPLNEIGGGPAGAALTTDDNKDRGTILHYYEGGSAVDAFIGWDNSNSEFALASNVAVDNNVVSFNEFGNVRVGNITAEGDISTSGNISITGNINITGSITSSGGGAAINGNAIPLGDALDGSLTSPGALDNWSNVTTVTDAIDDLNEVMLNVVKNTFVGNVDFTANVVAGPSPLALSFSRTFNGNATGYLWNFGDGTTSTSSTPTKTYANASGGQFTVTLTISNSSGVGAGASDDKVKTDYITLYTPTPIASFTLDKTSLDTGTSVSLTNTSQYAQSYVIYWGDGTSDTIATNSAAGGTTGGAKTHTYAVTGSADTRYQPYITATSVSAGNTPVTVTSSTQNVYVYKTHSPTFSTSTLEGNNDYTLTPNGWNVTFTNTTPAGLGATSIFSVNYYKWTWGDGTTTNVNAGSGSAGDRSVNIVHKYTLTNPAVNQTFTAKLEVYNGHSTSPFSSTTVTVTVHPDPQAIFTGNLVTLSDRTGDSSQTGYYFTDLNGINRAIVRFTNSSLNTDSYKWTWGDGTDSGTLTSGAGTPGSTIDHTFTSIGNYTIALLATGTYSESPTDNTNTKTNYISINAAPAAPAGLSSKTLSMTTASVGTSPYLAALATDNSGGNIPAAGTSVTRYTSGTVVTNTVADVYNSYTGTLGTRFNGADDGNIAFTSGDDAGTYGNLVVTLDRDAHIPSPATYPSNFYKVFSAYATKAIASISTGYNEIKLTHSATGNTNPVGYVKDDVTSVPSIDITSATLTTGTAGTQLYISGIPYFNTGSPTVVLAGAQIFNWIGQTYQNTTTPFSIAPDTNDESTSGSVIASQTKTYTNLDGATTFLSSGIPKANTGKDSGTKYTIGSQTINVAPASTAAVQTIKYSATNVNGTSATATVAKKIQVFTATPSGFVETSIPFGATTAKRIVIAGATGANPTYNNATNYYLNNAWSGAVTIAGTDEAVVRWNQLKWFNTDLSTGYLPVGPNLNSGRTSGNQYFRGAFSKTLVQNFRVTITGKISGLFFAVPGTAIDTASTLNGWINASITYDGSGVPGAGAGGNGSNGCASTPGDRVPLGSVISGTSYNMTLGSVSTGTAAAGSTGNQVLFSIVLASGDYITSWSFS